MHGEFGVSAKKAGAFAWFVTGLALAASPSALAESGLHKAARAGNLAEVRKLLDAGADVNAKDREGKTPLDYHAERENPSWPQVLKDAGGKCSRNC